MKYKYIHTVCPICGNSCDICVKTDDFINWYFYNTPIQDAFPYLPSDAREMLISGIYPSCWKTIHVSYDEEQPLGYSNYARAKISRR